MTEDYQRYDRLVEEAGGLGESHAWIVQQVPAGSTVLDCGCAGGYVARALAAQGCVVDAVDVDPQAAETAGPLCRRFLVGPLEEQTFLESLERPYSWSIFDDVLEHLVDPGTVLSRVRPLLFRDGRILIFIPNAANWRLRWKLLKGDLEYEEVGLLDRTHLRFYTFRTVRSLVEDPGHRILRQEFTVGRPPFIIGWRLVERVFSRFPNLAAYQSLIEAEPWPE